MTKKPSTTTLEDAFTRALSGWTDTPPDGVPQDVLDDANFDEAEELIGVAMDLTGFDPDKTVSPTEYFALHERALDLLLNATARMSRQMGECGDSILVRLGELLDPEDDDTVH